MSEEATNRPRRRLLALDGNEQTVVRRVLGRLPARGWDVFCLRPYAAAFWWRFVRHPGQRLFRWREVQAGTWEQFVLVPGFSRFPRLSLRLIEWARAAAVRRFGAPAVQLFTVPRYAPIAERRRCPAVYYAVDGYRFYPGWDHDRTQAEEDRMLRAVDAACAISRRLMEDWTCKTRGPIHWLPSATDESLLNTPPAVAAPSDLAGIPRPIAGCIGNINRGYDWALVAEAAERLPGVSFLFVGPITEKLPAIDSAARIANVHFLGVRPWSELPAYLRHFDVCFCPYALNELNHRRSPLRFYDFLTTASPVLTTNIREAREFEGLIEVARDAGEFVRKLADAVRPGYRVDLGRRRQFIGNQTWDDRATEFLAILDQAAGEAPA